MTRHAADLKTLLINHEGIRLKPYTDTVGKLTIGVGRNLVDKGITYGEAMALLDKDIADATNDCLHEFPWFIGLTEQRKWVILSMVFNLGLEGLKKFKRMLACVELEDYQGAAWEMAQSKWAQQVGMRAVELQEMMRGH